MTVYAFDLESEQGDENVIRALHDPFVKPAPPGEFRPEAVKTGNLKDPAKIAEKIEDARQAHAQTVANYAADCQAAEEKYWRDIFDRAALSASTGRVVVVGVKSASGAERFIDGDEPDILSSWWARWEELSEAGLFVGCNSASFDLPYLIRRSWVNQIPVPGEVWNVQYKRWHKSFIDVREHWLLGQRWADCPSSLDHIAKALGVGEKLPGEIAANFGRYWREQREVAQNYLRRDLDLTLGIARRIGIIKERAV